MANEKSKAEQYRDERKARIAQAAKKNAKSMEAKSTAKSAASKIISVILVAAICIGVLGGCLNYFGVLTRAVNIGKLDTGEKDLKVSCAEYEYYYMTIYNNLVNQISQYSQYYDYGYDTSLPPIEQTGTTTGENGEEVLWGDYIDDNVIHQIKQVKSYYNMAVKEGLELTDADKATIDQQIQNYKDQASNVGSQSGNARKYSLNAYLRLSYGSSINARFLKKMLKQQLLAYDYAQKVLGECKTSYSDDEILKAYNADKAKYDVVNFRVYSFKTEKLEANDGEKDEALEARQAAADAKVKADANAFLAAAKDEKTFIAKANELNKAEDGYDGEKETKVSSMTKDNVSQNFSEDVANWAFDNARKAGEKKLFTVEGETDTYLVILLTKTMHQEKTVDVRHILFMTKDSQNQNQPLSDEEIAEKKKNAEDALKSFQSGDKTEESFAALATELTEDTGSASNGGLYENVLPGQMVSEFDAWIFDAARKPGDVEIVETDYGYHVIYFVKNNGNYYDGAIRTEKANEDAEKQLTELVDADTNVISFGPRRADYAEKRVNKKIANLLQMTSASSASSANAAYGY